VTMKLYWHKLKVFFARKSPESAADKEDINPEV